MYADDTKIFRVIRDCDDCTFLQNDLASFENFCNANNLFLNPDKCCVISYTRKRNPVNYPYTLCNATLKRVSQIRDLGVIMDSGLTFVPHIDKILNKAFSQLGFILRVGKPFKKVSTYKLLYNSYVRSLLEFASPVWHPHYKVHVDRIERLQHKFVKALDYRCGHVYSSYEESAAYHKIDLLQNRRSLSDAMILYKIINNKLDAPALLERINFRVPRMRERACREKSLFSIPSSSTVLVSNSFVRRSCKFYNDNLIEVDLFQKSLTSYRKDCLMCLNGNS